MRFLILLLLLFSCKATVRETRTTQETLQVDTSKPIQVMQDVKTETDIVLPIEKETPKLSLQQIYTSQIGVREATGNNDGQKVEMYLKSVKLSKGNPWCAAFVKWCLDSAGIANNINGMALSTHRPSNLVFYKKQFLKSVQVGDVGTLYYVKLGRIGHTFFVDKPINTSIFKSVEGNTNEKGSREGDGVYYKYRAYNATYSISGWQ